MNSFLYYSKFNDLFKRTKAKKYFLSFLDENDIKYKKVEFSSRKNDFGYKLISDLHDSINKVQDYDDNSIANRYDYTYLLTTLKNKLLAKEDIFTI